MKTIQNIKRIMLTAVVVLSLGLALVPRSQASLASVQPTMSGHSVTDPTFGGGGKDGNESHG
jgi:hypothetical protein